MHIPMVLYFTVDLTSPSSSTKTRVVQLALNYQMYTSSPPEEHFAGGRPMFLIAVVGMRRPLLFPFLPEILRKYPFLRPRRIPGWLTNCRRAIGASMHHGTQRYW